MLLVQALRGAVRGQRAGFDTDSSPTPLVNVSFGGLEQGTAYPAFARLESGCNPIQVPGAFGERGRSVTSIAEHLVLFTRDEQLVALPWVVKCIVNELTRARDFARREYARLLYQLMKLLSVVELSGTNQKRQGAFGRHGNS